MPSALNIAGGELPPTPTYRTRLFWFVPGDSYRDGRAGTLHLRLAHRRGNRVESDSYAVEEEPRPVPGAGRSFLLLNLSDPHQADVYATLIGPVCACTCRAGLVGRHECKHIAAVRALIEEGAL